MSIVRRRVTLGPLVVILLVRSAAWAQSATATLTGVATDETGAAVPAVHVTLVNDATAFRREITTGPQGTFTLPLLPPGTYTLRAEREGFSHLEMPGIILNVNDQIAVNLRLKVAPVGESVTVTAEPTRINTSPAVSTVVDRQFAANIPLNGRSFQSLITLTPGVVAVPTQTNLSGHFSVNGQRSTSNSFIVDGVSGNFGTATAFLPGAQTSGNLPGLTTFGSTQSLVSVDALEEFRVQTSTYSAEYGRQPGGQISIVTRSGTNQIHGSLFDYMRHDAFDANDWFANRSGQPKARERQHDFGGTLGGPVRGIYDGRDRTFFFLSYEGLRLRQPQFDTTNVPSLALRQLAPAAVQTLLHAFPIPNGKDLANGLSELATSYSDTSSLDATSVRLDHAVNSKLALFGRFNWAPSSTSSRRAGINLSSQQFGQIDTQTLTLGMTTSLTTRMANEFRANISDNGGTGGSRQDDFGGAVPVSRSVLIPSPYDSRTAQGAVTLLFPQRTSGSVPVIGVAESVLDQRQFNIVDHVSLRVGSHQLKCGVDYRLMTPVLVVQTYVSSITFMSAQEVLNGIAGTGSIRAYAEARPRYVNFSAYAQDSWTLSGRMTVDVGVRWDVNPAPTETNANTPPAVNQIGDVATMQLAPVGTSLWRTTHGNLAPRIGMAYQLRTDPGRETILRGGFGVYYDTGNEQGSTGHNGFPLLVTRSISNVAYPLTATQLTPPVVPAPLIPPYDAVLVFDPNLRLPYTLQWNVAVEQSLGKAQGLWVSYVGSAGRRLLQRRELNLARINPIFTTVWLTTNRATSDYKALQVQFRRRLSRGLQTVASYTWSHAIDEDSTSSGVRLAQRGNAAFDVRHNVAAAVTYDVPWPRINRAVTAVLGQWSMDATVHAQSAPPVDVVGSTIIDPTDGSIINVRPNVNLGVPYYLDDPISPGGRRINKSAFSVPTAGESGTLGRNTVRSLAAWQVDLALRRHITVSGKLGLQLRAEAFNIFNHPNFGSIQTLLTAPNFGQATNMRNRQLGGLSALYQIGGPRSIQLAVRLQF